MPTPGRNRDHPSVREISNFRIVANAFNFIQEINVEGHDQKIVDLPFLKQSQD